MYLDVFALLLWHLLTLFSTSVCHLAVLLILGLALFLALGDTHLDNKDINIKPGTRMTFYQCHSSFTSLWAV